MISQIALIKALSANFMGFLLKIINYYQLYKINFLQFEKIFKNNIIEIYMFIIMKVVSDFDRH